MQMSFRKILLGHAFIILYMANPVLAENNQFAVELTNNQSEWNINHALASSGRVDHSNELMTILSKPQSVEPQPQKKTNNKVEVFDKKGVLIAIKTLDSNGKVIDVEFINKIENIDRKSGAATKNIQSDGLTFMQNDSPSEDLIANLEI